MKYHELYSLVLPAFLKKYGDSKKALEEFLKVQRKSIPLERINRELSGREESGKKYQGPLLQDSFSAEEKRDRAALSVEIREKMARHALNRIDCHEQAQPLIAAKIVDQSQKDLINNGDFYPEELLYDFSGASGTAEKNAKISALFINASHAAAKMKEGEKNPYEREINDQYITLIRRFEGYQLDKLFSRDLSDKELVENFEKIEACKALSSQMENIRDTYRRLRIPISEKLDMRMRALVPKIRIPEKYEQRLALIESPYYSEIDSDDPALSAIREDPVAKQVINDLANEDPVPKELMESETEFSQFSTNVLSYDTSYYSAENEAIGEFLQQLGAKRENIVFEIDGKLSEQPFYRPNADGTVNFDWDVLPKLNSGAIKSVRVFDKTDPTLGIEIPKISGKNYPFNKLLLGNMELKAPQPPKEVGKPGGIKSFFHKRFGAFKADFDAYQKYQEESASYPARLAEFEALTKLDNTLKAKLKENEKIKREKEERENLKSVEPSKDIAEGLERMLSAYSNKPRYLEQYTAKGNNLYAGISKETFHTLENFDIEGFTVGGAQISEMEFASLAMAGVMQPGSGVMEVKRHSEQRDNYDEDTLFAENLTMFTADIAKGRDASIGEHFIGIKNGRIAARQALRDYQNGDPGKMVDILANGMMKLQMWLCEADMGSVATDCPVEFFSKMAGLIERDETLKALVEKRMDEMKLGYAEREKAFGEKAKTAYEKLQKLGESTPGMAQPGSEFDKVMEEYEVSQTAYDHYRWIREMDVSLSGSLKTIKSFRIVNELSQKANVARETLRDAALSGKPLPEDKKRECIQDMLRTAAMSTCYSIQREDSSDRMIRDFDTPRMNVHMKASKCRPGALAHLQAHNKYALTRPVMIMDRLRGKNGIANLDTYVELSLKEGTRDELMKMSEKDLVMNFSHTNLTNRMQADRLAMAKEHKLAREKEKQAEQSLEKQNGLRADKGKKNMRMS